MATIIKTPAPTQESGTAFRAVAYDLADMAAQAGVDVVGDDREQRCGVAPLDRAAQLIAKLDEARVGRALIDRRQSRRAERSRGKGEQQHPIRGE